MDWMEDLLVKAVILLSVYTGQLARQKSCPRGHMWALSQGVQEHAPEEVSAARQTTLQSFAQSAKPLNKARTASESKCYEREQLFQALQAPDKSA